MPFEPSYRFDNFYLDVENRQLLCDGEPVDLNARYFDALALLVREQGNLVRKDQFFTDVWDDIMVSDAALTQCIKDIRRRLGDDATAPKYIQTVPRHGYRFIREVETPYTGEPQTKGGAAANIESSTATSGIADRVYSSLRRILIECGGGTLGGIAAGLLGGFIYGFGLAETSGGAGMGAASMLLVLVTLNVIIGGMGGLGVSSGMAAGNVLTGGNKIWTVVGGAFGGLLVGGLTKLLGVDAFNLLFGVTPDGITGGVEGALLGAFISLGVLVGGGLNTGRLLKPVMTTALGGMAAGVLVTLTGGRLMAGSLDLLADSFAGSQLRLDALGRYFGETEFGYLTQMVLSGLEGFLFAACVAGGILYLRRLLGSQPGKMDA